MVLLIPILGGLIGAAARKFLPGIVRTVGGKILGTGAAATGAKVARAAIPSVGGKITRVIGGGAAAAAAAAVLPGGAKAPGPVMVGNVNLNPWASTARRRPRRINPTNPKALKRAMRRVEQFGDFAKAMGYSRPPRCIAGFKGLPKRKRASKCR